VSVIHGVVRDFDEQRGDGVLETPRGETFYFHCVEIADGTRTIAEGASVVATRRVGLRGRDEAAGVYSPPASAATRT